MKSPIWGVTREARNILNKEQNKTSFWDQQTPSWVVVAAIGLFIVVDTLIFIKFFFNL
jgi:hypothetical protein